MFDILSIPSGITNDFIPFFSNCLDRPSTGTTNIALIFINS